MLSNIEEYHSKWFHPQDHSISKRGLINPIGNLQRVLFETLDNTDAEYYLKEFESLHENNNLQNSIIKNQTTLIQSAINLMKQIDFKVNKTIEHIQKAIGELNKDSQETTLTIFKTNANELFKHVILGLIQFLENQKIYLIQFS